MYRKDNVNSRVIASTASIEEGMLDKSFFLIIPIVIVMFAWTGCSYPGKQAGNVTFSGFLGKDYDKLSKGGPEQPLYSYINPDADIGSYHKILLDRVDVIYPKEEGVSSDWLIVAHRFHSQLEKELSKDWEIVKEPGTDTMRIQIALTDISAGSAVMQVVSSVEPLEATVSGLNNMTGAKPLFAGDVSIEGKVTDATTGKLLMAGVDRRIADKSLKTAIDTWAALDNVTATWSKLLAYRLCKERKATNCVWPLSGRR